jgi:hypothetical protein
LIHHRDDPHATSPRKTQELRKKCLVTAQMSITFFDIFIFWIFIAVRDVEDA